MNGTIRYFDDDVFTKAVEDIKKMMKFKVQNTGFEDMLLPIEFIVTQDEVMHYPSPPTFQLDALAAESILVPANGATRCQISSVI